MTKDNLVKRGVLIESQ